MKKLVGIFALIICAGMAFAQNAKYTELLNKAKDYEAKKQYAYALGYYYDAIEADLDNCEEAYEGWKKLSEAIKNGKPGLGEYDEFSIYDGWIALLQNSEKYWTEFCPYTFFFSGLAKGELNYQTKTAEYSTVLSTEYTSKYDSIMTNTILVGYKKARKDNWSCSEEWPKQSVFTMKDGSVEQIYKKYGVALVKYPKYTKDIILGEEYVGGYDVKIFYYSKNDWYAHAAFTNYYGIEALTVMGIIGDSAMTTRNYNLFDANFSLCDLNGNEITKSKRLLMADVEGPKERHKYTFTVDAKNMSLIDNYQYTIKITNLFLEYGYYKPENEEKTSPLHAYTRKFVQTFFDLPISMAKCEYVSPNSEKKKEQVFVAIEKKKEESKKILSSFGVSTKEDLIKKIIADNTLTHEYVTAFGTNSIKEFCKELNRLTGYKSSYKNNGEIDSSSNGFVCTSENRVDKIIAEGDLEAASYYIHSLDSEIEKKIMEVVERKEKEAEAARLKAEEEERQRKMSAIRSDILKFISQNKSTQDSIVAKFNNAEYSAEYIKERISELEKSGFVMTDKKGNYILTKAGKAELKK